jgi:hypothetical protein
MGPFYCTRNQTVYLDAPFLAQVGADFGPLAVVAAIAHEVAHHAQAQLGLGAAQLSVQHELQADCLTGVLIATLVADAADPVAAVDGVVPFMEWLGDPATSSGFADDAHGLGPQRALLFERGAFEGLADCAEI